MRKRSLNTDIVGKKTVAACIRNAFRNSCAVLSVRENLMGLCEKIYINQMDIMVYALKRPSKKLCVHDGIF